MKIQYFIALGLLFSVSCKRELKRTISRFPNGEPSSVVIYPDETDTTNCKIFLYHDNGKIKLELTIENGKYIGKKITYYHSGIISQIDSLSQPCDTSQNECDGFLIRYYENGNISQRYMIRNNIFNGMSQHYLNNGILAKEYELRNGMTKNGIYREFHDNGKVAFECNYQNDTIVGFGYYFNEKGDTIKYYNHQNGVISFPYKKWLDNEEILMGNFTNKSANSVTWKWYDKNGKQLKNKVTYAKGGGFAAPE